MFGEGNAVIPKNGMGVIAKQLSKGLLRSEIQYGKRVKEVLANEIILHDESRIQADSIIIATDGTPVLKNVITDIQWKGSTCLYFETEKKVIKDPIIGLIADEGALINNIFYPSSLEGQAKGKELLSVTVVKEHGLSEKDLVNHVKTELKSYCEITTNRHLKTFYMPKSLPNLKNVKNDIDPSSTKISDHIFAAGDYLINGSQHAAILSGERAAEGLLEDMNK